MACALFPLAASAATPAFDSAADPAYDDGWQDGDNGGFGWGGGWTFSGRTPGGQFIGDSTANGDGDTAPPSGDINTPRALSGRAWGLRSHGSFSPNVRLSGTAFASRAFDGALSIGQTFSIDFDSGTYGGAAAGGFPNSLGVTLYHAVPNGRQAVWGFQLQGGEGPEANFYYIANTPDANGNLIRGPAFTDEGVHIEFTLLPANRYSAAITPFGAETTVYTGELGGFQFQGDNRSPDSLLLHSVNWGDTPGGRSFFNNMGIGQVPEPSGALAVFGLIVSVAMRRRRRW